ncbi:MAG: guanylate kinase [Candidatus Moranbacteria bacterium]|nr:guanylate kinase [Candidatus Moranbacteria bacterium]
MKNNNKILVISGPTGSGESTITNKIIAKNPVFQRLITATSRPMRKGEQNGKDYYFFSKEQFEKLIREGVILEHTYIENRDTYYGTYGPELKKEMINGYVIVNVDRIGTTYYKNNFDTTAIFIKPESIESLKVRLRNRNPEMTDIELEKRLENAKNEIENEEKYYDVTVVNKDGALAEAVSEIENILKDNDFVF